MNLSVAPDRLSLTKWIHLHGLDEGLIKFFQKCFDCLEPGGKLVLEKQGWRGYKDAKRSTQVGILSTRR
jgi:7SK snRNA methylphosphate capping enzyme